MAQSFHEAGKNQIFYLKCVVSIKVRPFILNQSKTMRIPLAHAESILFDAKSSNITLFRNGGNINFDFYDRVSTVVENKGKYYPFKFLGGFEITTVARFQMTNLHLSIKAVFAMNIIHIRNK